MDVLLTAASSDSDAMNNQFPLSRHISLLSFLPEEEYQLLGCI